MLSAPGESGIEEELVPLYVLLLKTEADFQYMFDLAPLPESLDLERDLERLLEAEYITKNSPLTITEEGRRFLEQFGAPIQRLEATFSRRLAEYRGRSLQTLLELAYVIQTA